MFKKILWAAIAVLALLVVGCDNTDIGSEVKRKATEARFVKVDLGSTGEIYFDTVGRKSWVRFANTSNVVEVLYVDYLKMQAESEIP